MDSLQFYALLTLNVLGIIITGYMMISHYMKKQLVCFLGDACNDVAKSKWSTIFYVRNEFLGFVFYNFLLIALIALKFYSFNFSWFSLILLIGVLIGTVYSLFLTAIQFFVLKKYCFYCLTLAMINIFIFIIVVTSL
jgi:uncharacterized membrane protein